jgi:hypothetical protein
LAGLLGRHIGGDHVLAALEESLQHGLAERLLAVNHDAHVSPQVSVSGIRKSQVSGIRVQVIGGRLPDP